MKVMCAINTMNAFLICYYFSLNCKMPAMSQHQNDQRTVN